MEIIPFIIVLTYIGMHLVFPERWIVTEKDEEALRILSRMEAHIQPIKSPDQEVLLAQCKPVKINLPVAKVLRR
jgi:hypothetical protein